MIDAIIAHQISGVGPDGALPSVRREFLVEMFFTSITVRVWTGRGDLVANGVTWSGLGAVATIDGLDAPIGESAPLLSLGLSGVDPLIALMARNSKTEVGGRTVRVLMAFFDDAGMLLSAPIVIRTATMTRMKFDCELTKWTITAEAETFFVRRSQPMFSALTHTDQNSRAPGDKGCEFVASMVNSTTVWPPA